jgi:hypothetical protein
MDDYQRAREAVTRAVKRRWRTAERATFVEMTTGYGPRSGGRRRPHWNDLWLFIPPEDADELRKTLVESWCSRVSSNARAQFTGAVSEVGGLMRYLALHFQKESQQPPVGWRGHRFTTTRGYVGRPMAEARADARAALRARRELHRALAMGLSGEEAEAEAARQVAYAQRLDWALVDWKRTRKLQAIDALWADARLVARPGTAAVRLA